jgi:hypothetical protein
MTYVLRFLPEVEADVLKGLAWYEDKSPGLGEEFLRLLCVFSGIDSKSAIVQHCTQGFPTMFAAAISLCGVLPDRG